MVQAPSTTRVLLLPDTGRVRTFFTIIALLYIFSSKMHDACRFPMMMLVLSSSSNSTRSRNDDDHLNTCNPDYINNNDNDIGVT